MRKTFGLAALVLAVGLVQISPADSPRRSAPRVERRKSRATWLFVQTRPAGAKLELDGKPLGKSEGLFAVPPGLHRISVQWDGRQPKQQEIPIPGGRVTRLLIERERPPARSSIEAFPPAVTTPAAPLVVQPRPRYSVLNLPWGSVSPADEPPALTVLAGHDDQVNWVEFSPDGRILASAGADSTVRLWSIPSGRLRHVLVVAGSRLGVASVAFSPDGRRLASCAGGIVRVWDPETGRLLLASEELGSTRGIAFSADGKTLTVATGADTVTLCDSESLGVQSVLRATPPTEVVLLGHDESVRRIAYSPDESLLACGGGWHPQAPGRVTIWDTGTGSLVSSFETPGGCVRAVAISPDRTLLAYATGSTVKLVAMASLPKPKAAG